MSSERRRGRRRSYQMTPTMRRHLSSPEGRRSRKSRTEDEKGSERFWSWIDHAAWIAGLAGLVGGVGLAANEMPINGAAVAVTGLGLMGISSWRLIRTSDWDQSPYYSRFSSSPRSYDSSHEIAQVDHSSQRSGGDGIWNVLQQPSNED